MRRPRLFGRGNGDAVPGEIHEALDSSARRFREPDPLTGEQWRLLSATLDARTEHAAVPRRGTLAWMVRPALAVGALACVIAVALVLQDPGVRSTVYETQRGQQTTLSLVDGSEVLMNHTSLLSVEGGAAARRVSLEGEAFFRIRKTGEPFVVTTDIGTVTVLGTQFNVRVRNQMMEVAVVEGSVRVTGGADGAEREVLLTAGELTTCTERGVPAPPTRLLHASYPGWIHGRLMFDRTSLSAACRELEDQFDITLRLNVPHADEIMITGVLDATNVDAALTTLARLTGTTYTHDQGDYILR